MMHDLPQIWSDEHFNFTALAAWTATNSLFRIIRSTLVDSKYDCITDSFSDGKPVQLVAENCC